MPPPDLQDYRRGQQLIKDRTFQDNEEFFQAVFEVRGMFRLTHPIPDQCTGM
jgi:hypothetical protein